MSKQDKAGHKTPPRFITDLQPKMKLTGRVEKVELFGAVLDIGVDHPALLHISQMSGEPTTPAEKQVQAGEEITVWILKVDAQSGRIQLSMIEPIAVDWHELKPGQVREGKVVRLEKYGAFVNIGAEREGLVHIRELTSGLVRHPSEVVSIGDEVEVKVTAVDRKKRRVDLSMRALEVEPVEDTEETLPTMTSLEAALRAAMDTDKTVTKRPKRKHEKVATEYARRVEIFRRTLSQRG